MEPNLVVRGSSTKKYFSSLKQDSRKQENNPEALNAGSKIPQQQEKVQINFGEKTGLNDKELARSAFRAFQENVVSEKKKWTQNVVAQAHAKTTLLRRYWSAWESAVQQRQKQQIQAVHHWAFSTKKSVMTRFLRYSFYRKKRKERYAHANFHYENILKDKVFHLLFQNVRHARIRGWKVREFQMMTSLSRNKRLKAFCFAEWQQNSNDGKIRAKRHYETKTKIKILLHWKKFWSSVKLEKGKFNRASRFATTRALWKHLSAWSLHTRKTVEERELRLLDIAIQQNRIFHLIRGLSAFSNNLMSRRIEKKNLYLASLFRYHVLIYGCFKTWASAAKPRIVRNKKERQSIRLYYINKTKFAFSQWKRFLIKTKTKYDQNIRALQHWAYRQKKTFMVLWAKGAAASLVEKAQLDIASDQYRSFHCSKALDKLRCFKEFRSEQRHLKKSAINHWKKRTQKHALKTLFVWSINFKALREKKHIAVAYHRKKILQTVWHTLYENLLEERERSLTHLEILEGIIQRRERKILISHFEALSEYYKKRMIRRLSKIRATSIYEHKLTAKVFNEWHDWSIEHRANLFVRRRALAMYAEKLINRYFERWCQYIYLRNIKIQKNRDATLLWAKHTKLRIWKCWSRDFLSLRAQKKRRLAMAAEWRRRHLVRTGACTWLNASIATQTRRERAIEEITAAKAAALTRRVAKYAYHWRAVVLQRRLKKKTKSDVFGMPTSHSAFRLKPVDASHLKKNLPRSVYFSEDSANKSLVRSQIEAALSLDWVDKILPTSKGPRPLPRRMSLVDEDLQVQPNKNLSFSFPQTYATYRTQKQITSNPRNIYNNQIEKENVHSNQLDIEEASKLVKEYEQIKLQANQEKLERSSLRQQLRNISPHQNSAEFSKRILDRLGVLQKKKAEFELYKSQVYPQLCRIAQMSKN